ncbi:hypothetical protein SynMITS9220_01133 [Synechococcus sp. MIT S9220]|uniref:hypothetical protein n=1 Tax=unclassified Synechococcus TaxID=2626047 RepID=UPI00164BE7F1|nr:hypothetical protein [Synechococcus sp. MIT S9220]NOL47261.1 hypothetical protein [Synechococcus sp. MIT S9220]QNJ22437.1 hypothetical protein SynMITS9220_01133 [Synechococcus sp. MIT S9220]
MKRISAIAAVAVASLLLAGYQSKRDTCAQCVDEGPYASDELAADYFNRLGLKLEPEKGDANFQKRWAIKEFCEFYKF